MRVTLRYSEDASIVMVQDADGFRAPTQAEMNALPVGDDLTDEEVEGLDS